MARTGITYADVQRAIDALIARGDAPSVQRIRDVLGTGSYTTISEHLRHWREEREKNRDVPPPKGVPEAIVTLATDMWRQACDAANEELAHYREEANRQAEAAQEEARRARQEAEHAAQRESALAEHLRQREVHTEARLEELGTALADSRAECEQLNAHHARAEQARQVLKEENEELAARLTHMAQAHEEETAALRQSFDRERAEEQQRNEAIEGKLLALLDGVRQEYRDEEKAYRRQLSRLEARVEAAREDNAGLKRELKAAKDATRQQQQREAALEDQVAAATAARDEAVASCRTLEQTLERARQQLEEERKRRDRDGDWQASLAQRLDALQQRLAALPSEAGDDDASAK